MDKWDDNKRRTNLDRHGIDFRSADDFDWETALIDEDVRFDYGERRYSAKGLIGSRVHVLVYTWREGVRRIISLRKANKREAKDYVSRTRD